MIDILPLFKMLADETRIRILALLLDRDSTAEEVSSALGMDLRVVTRQLGSLASVGLVETAGPEGPPRYRFRQEPLREAMRSLAAAAPQQRVDENAPEYDQKILSTFMIDGRLKSIPAQQKKRDPILRFLARQFEPSRMYQEREVNDILRRYHDDVASLRRYLVDGGFLQRQVVRVADTAELMAGNPSIELQVTYWKPPEDD